MTSSMPPTVDVVVPIYGNLGDACRAIRSVFEARNEMRAHVVAIDDCSPDPDSMEILSALGPRENFTLLRNECNLGFPATVNRGFALHPDRDVAILNSDTLAFDGWLDRLCAVLAAHPRAGTVTPLSNAATILSYPQWLIDNPEPLEIGWAALDRLCAQSDAAPAVIPTGVGFCMLFRRTCLESAGLFDAEAFGQGYGEENDLCRRAAEAGWENLAAPNVFVWHRGGGSFGAGKEAKARRAQQVIEQRHPGYAALIGDYIRENPLAPFRAGLDAARVCARPSPRIVTLGPPPASGGFGLAREGGFWRRRWRLAGGGCGPLPNLPAFHRGSSDGEIGDWLARCGIEGIDIPPFCKTPPALVGKFVRAARALGLPVTDRRFFKAS